MELGLFRYLQDVSNVIKRNDVAKNQTYIMFLLWILVMAEPLNRKMAQMFNLVSLNFIL